MKKLCIFALVAVSFSLYGSDSSITKKSRPIDASEGLGSCPSSSSSSFSPSSHASSASSHDSSTAAHADDARVDQPINQVDSSWQDNADIACVAGGAMGAGSGLATITGYALAGPLGGLAVAGASGYAINSAVEEMKGYSAFAKKRNLVIATTALTATAMVVGFGLGRLGRR